MNILFDIEDKSKRRIRLTREQWRHIQEEHHDVKDIDEIKEILENPIKISPSKYDPDSVVWYYGFNKKKKRYLCVTVKYLNGDGFIITAFNMRNIK